MDFTNIKPFVRYAQIFHVDKLGVSKGNNRFVDRELIPRDCRFIYCLSGEGEISLGGEVHKIYPGDAVIIPSGESYSFIRSSEDVRYVTVNYDYTWDFSSAKRPLCPMRREAFNEKKLFPSHRFIDDDDLKSSVVLRRVSRIENKLSRLLDIYSRKVIFYEMELSCVFSTVLIQCKRAKALNALEKSNDALDATFRYIREHFSERLTNKDIADKFGYNQNYISSLVKIATGVTLHRYLRNIRIEKAVEYLEQTGKSISEISELCGFYDIYHFSKVFKAEMGKSPTDYRK